MSEGSDNPGGFDPLESDSFESDEFESADRPNATSEQESVAEALSRAREHARKASAEARLIAVVVLPTPPF